MKRQLPAISKIYKEAKAEQWSVRPADQLSGDLPYSKGRVFFENLTLGVISSTHKGELRPSSRPRRVWNLRIEQRIVFKNGFHLTPWA